MITKTQVKTFHKETSELNEEQANEFMKTVMVMNVTVKFINDKFIYVVIYNIAKSKEINNVNNKQ